MHFLTAAWQLRLVAKIMWSFSLHDKTLELLPVELMFCESCLFFLLCLLVLEKEDTNEEIEEEETAEENEDNEENGLARTILLLGTIVFFCDVDGLVHDVWPPFERGYDE